MLPGMIKTSGLDPDHEDDLTYIVGCANGIRRGEWEWDEVYVSQDSWDAIGSAVTGLLGLLGIPFTAEPGTGITAGFVYVLLGPFLPVTPETGSQNRVADL